MRSAALARHAGAAWRAGAAQRLIRAGLGRVVVLVLWGRCFWVQFAHLLYIS
jgi:hypothetical protein